MPPKPKGGNKSKQNTGVDAVELQAKFFPIYQRNLTEKGASICTSIDNKLKASRDEGTTVFQLTAGPNEHLSDYYVWGLVDALKKSEFRDINGIRLWNCTISDLAIKYICEQIKEYQSIIVLELTNCKISPKGCQQIGEALNPRKEDEMSVGGVKFLHLDNNPIGDEGLRNLNIGLRMNMNIDNLSLKNCEITHKSAVPLLEMLIFKDSKIKELDLEGNEIAAEGAIMVFKAMKLNHSLIQLNLSNNKIEESNEFVDSFISFVKQDRNTVEILNLSKNNVNHMTCNRLHATLMKFEHNFSNIILPDKVDKDLAQRIGEFMKSKNKKKKKKK